MWPDTYKVEVLHYINPHLIWVLVEIEGEGNIFFEQIGLYGILPQNITFGIDFVAKTERCDQWMPAAVFVMKQILLEAAEIWFTPTYIDNKISIFDNNTHKYGDLTVKLKNGERVNLLEEIIKSQFAFKDEGLFYDELRDRNLNIKLKYTLTRDIIKRIEESYKTRDIPKNIWMNALKRQTSILQEAKQLETDLLSRQVEVQNRNNVETLLKNKLNDLKLCKDVDEDSAGRANRNKSSKASSLLSVSLRKKLDALQSQNNDDVHKTVSKPSPVLMMKPVEDKKQSCPNIEQNNNEESIKLYFNEDTNSNAKMKKGKMPKKLNKFNNDTKFIALGPAGLQVDKFTIKAELDQKEEIAVKEQKVKKTVEKEETVKKDQDVYSKTDSEVNINVSNLEVLKKIRLTHTFCDNSSVDKSDIVNAEVKQSAMSRRIKYVEEKISKFNDSLSSTSDKDSSKCELDSDCESITALEKKLGIGEHNRKRFVIPEPPLETFVKDVKSYVNPFKNLDGSVSIFVDKLVSPVLMVHTKKDNYIQPLSNMRDIPFGIDIHRALKNMSIRKPMRPQTISWPTILRGHSFFLIGPHDSGNTMGYLPAVCRLVNDNINSSSNSALSCIILCATSHSVSSVETACKMFLHNAKIFACYAGISDINIATSILNGIDLLICTPTMLVRLIQDETSLNLRKLSTFVIDDCEHMSKVYLNELKFCLIKVRDVVKNRANKEWKVQYVVISRLWCDFMSSLAKNAPDSVVCISAFEECVLYAKASTSVEFVMQEKKLDTIINFLKDIDKSKKTVIVCKTDEEVKIVEKTLLKLKYVVFACDNTMTVQDLYNLDKILRDYKEPVSGPVLVCCDGNLTHLNVTDAHYLVHYSLPALFSIFCKRFAVLVDNYPSVFKTNNSNIKIKILLDDNNIEQLPKIHHFIKRCTQDVPPILDEISASVLSEKDLTKAKNSVPVCTKLLTLGQCPDFWNCIERHAIFKEYDEPKAWLPRDGVITFQMLHFHSAVFYSARITSCNTKNNTIKYPQSYSLLSLKMGMYYSKEVNRKLHGAPEVGDVCAVTLKQNLFVRCRVCKILRSTNNQPSLVLIKLIDEEKYETARDTWLYYLPDNLKCIETHVVQIILANVMPQDRDVTFSKLAKNQLKKIVDENDDIFMRGRISLVVGNCVWVDTLEACQELSSLEEIVVKHDFRKELLDNHAVPNPDHIDKIKNLCKDIHCNTKEDEQIIEIAKPIKVLPKGRWAHLESDTFSSVFFMSAEDPCKFFVRPVKFEKCLTILIKDIKKYVSECSEPVDNINVGDIVLAEFPDDSTYERARIDEIIDSNKVRCFFVDQADWRYVLNKKILPITESFITVLPFQAIECRLVGIDPVGDAWTDFSTNFLADNCYDSADKLKYLYTKYFTKEKAESTEGHKYGVVLIDTYSEEDVIINLMMIDKNLAQENDETELLYDLQFKRESSESSELDYDVEDLPTTDEAISPNNKNELIQPFSHQPSNTLLRSVPLVDSDDNFDDFDFVTDNSGNIGSIPLAQVVGIKEISDMQSIEPVRTDVATNSFNVSERSLNEIKNLPPKSDVNSQDVNSEQVMESFTGLAIDYVPERPLNATAGTDVIEVTPKKALSKLDYISSDQNSKPKLLWRQNNNSVTIKINLIVEIYDMTIKERYLKFSANANDTKYGFDFELYGVIDLRKSSHANKGQYIEVKLWKLMARSWLTLTRDSAVTKWIMYDLDNIDVSSDEEGPDDSYHTKQCMNAMEDSDSDDNFNDDISFSYKK